MRISDWSSDVCSSDLALHPKRFAEIDHMVSTRTPERDLYLHQVIHQVEERLEELRLTAEVTGRPKHMWSIYEQMVVKGREFDDIFDLVAIRGVGIGRAPCRERVCPNV